MQRDRREDYYQGRLDELCRLYPNLNRTNSELALSVAITYDVFHSAFAKWIGEFGLAKSTFNILTILRFGPPEGMQLSEIGELLLTSRANVTGLIDHLEQKGFVKRAVDIHDRRARIVRLTKKGEQLIDEALPLHHGRCATVFAHMTNEERETLIRLLKKARQSPVLQEAVGSDAHGSFVSMSD